MPLPPLAPEAEVAPAATEPVRRAEEVVRAYCGWHIAPVVSTTEWVLPSQGVALLRSLMVTAAPVVDGTAVAAEDWRPNGVVAIPGSTRHVQVTYSHGYEAVPADVLGVIRTLAARISSDPGALTQVGQVRYAVSLAQGAGLGGALSDYDRSILDRYKLPPRP